jgi:hypothetical protein
MSTTSECRTKCYDLSGQNGSTTNKDLQLNTLSVNHLFAQCATICNLDPVPAPLAQNIGCDDPATGLPLPPNPDPASGPLGPPPFQYGEVYAGNSGNAMQFRRLSVNPASRCELRIDTVGDCIEFDVGCPNVINVCPGELIQDAINDAAGLATPAQRWLVHICPGTYVENLTMAPWITLQGASRDSVFIQSTSGLFAAAPATLQWLNAAAGEVIEIENLTLLGSSAGAPVSCFFGPGANPNADVQAPVLSHVLYLAGAPTAMCKVRNVTITQDIQVNNAHFGCAVRIGNQDIADEGVLLEMQQCDVIAKTTLTPIAITGAVDIRAPCRRGCVELLALRSQLRAYDCRFMQRSQCYGYSAPLIFVHDRAVRSQTANYNADTPEQFSAENRSCDVIFRFCYFQSSIATTQPRVECTYTQATVAPPLPAAIPTAPNYGYNGNYNNVSIDYYTNAFRPAFDLRDNAFGLYDHCTYITSNPWGFLSSAFWVHDGTHLFISQMNVGTDRNTACPQPNNANHPGVAFGTAPPWFVWCNFDRNDDSPTGNSWMVPQASLGSGATTVVSWGALAGNAVRTANSVPFAVPPVVQYGSLNVIGDHPVFLIRDSGNPAFQFPLTFNCSDRIHSRFFLNRTDDYNATTGGGAVAPYMIPQVRQIQDANSNTGSDFVASGTPGTVAAPPSRVNMFGPIQVYNRGTLGEASVISTIRTDMRLILGTPGASHTLTLNRDLYCEELALIDPGAGNTTTLVTNGYRIFVRNTCFLSERCVIHNDALGPAPAGAPGGTLGGGAAGGLVGLPGNPSTNFAGAGTNLFANITFGHPLPGHPVTNGGAPPGPYTTTVGRGGGIAAGAVTVNLQEGAETIFFNPHTAMTGRTLDGLRITGGSGGEGGVLGEGGGGGGVVMIVAHTIASTAGSIIRARGGTAVPPDGGGGGGGHVIFISYNDYYAGVIDVSGGLGVNRGNTGYITRIHLE